VYELDNNNNNNNNNSSRYENNCFDDFVKAFQWCSLVATFVYTVGTLAEEKYDAKYFW